MTLSQSPGNYLAENIRAPFDLPAFDNSAMDGYAVCGLEGTYRIVGEVAAGDTSNQALKEGEAMRIFTGGKVPQNTAAVVMQEKTEVDGTSLMVLTEIKESQNVRPRGSELSKGQEVFQAGHMVTPATVGLIGSLGFEKVQIYQKPVISLISTGNELIPPGQPLKEGQIYESNSFAINSALEKYGFNCSEKKQIEDDYEKTKKGIADYLKYSDVLLLSGGISVGDYDYVSRALIENGVEEIFYKVFQKPGKPLFFGKKGEKFVFALPGNPASSLTCFYVYVLPLLQRLSGAQHPGLNRMEVALAHDHELKGDRPAFLKARIDFNKVSVLDGQSSSMIHSMALANAFIYLKDPGSYQQGTAVECILLH